MRKSKFSLYGIALLFLSSAFIEPNNTVVYAESSAIIDSPTTASDMEEINTREQLVTSFIKHITNLDKIFTFKISYSALQNTDNDFNELWFELAKFPEYNEIMDNADIEDTKTYSYGDYFTLQVKVSYNISKEAAQKLLNDVQPIIKSENELIEAVIQHTKNLDKNYHLNVDKSVLDISNQKQYDVFWTKLYEIPVFNDISRYFIDFDSSNNSYSNYCKWKINTKYNITKKELNDLDKFVVNWVAKNINEKMTAEEKIRVINDFIVSKYRYTFGKKVKYTSGGNTIIDHRLGKYSSFSTFALLYEEGGVCDAKAKLFYRLAEKAGFEVLYVTGYVNKKTLHSWNLVKIDKNWYHVDPTWNRGTTKGMKEHEYFNTRDYYLKSDSSMIKGKHTWIRSKYPAAKKDYPIK